MARRQKNILGIALFFAALVGLFPPWSVTWYEDYPIRSGPFHRTEFRFLLGGLLGGSDAGSLAIWTLLAEWAVILFLAGAATLLARTRNR